MYSTKKVAEQYGISEHLVRGMAREGILPAENDGGRWQLGEEATEILDDLVAAEDGEDDDGDYGDEDSGEDWSGEDVEENE